MDRINKHGAFNIAALAFLGIAAIFACTSNTLGQDNVQTIELVPTIGPKVTEISVDGFKLGDSIKQAEKRCKQIGSKWVLVAMTRDGTGKKYSCTLKEIYDADTFPKLRAVRQTDKVRVFGKHHPVDSVFTFYDDKLNVASLVYLEVTPWLNHTKDYIKMPEQTETNAQGEEESILQNEHVYLTRESYVHDALVEKVYTVVYGKSK